MLEPLVAVRPQLHRGPAQRVAEEVALSECQPSAISAPDDAMMPTPTLNPESSKLTTAPIMVILAGDILLPVRRT